MARMAVTVRDAQLSFTSKKSSEVVLQNFQMNIPRGAIYGLLGASGCGKTSLLTCIVGLRRLDSGRITVLGGDPHPGHVGYMPQDTALMGEFNIRDTMFFYGRIFNMNKNQIVTRLEFFTKLFDLPPAYTLVRNLSGGEGRRVSLCVALLHEPQLIILDEPTVGLDPVLRYTIWKYLQELTEVEHKTVIITTHYIEEVRQANVVGMLRGGVLLEEGPPDDLMKRHDSSTMEQVFLKLSVDQSRSAHIPADSKSRDVTSSSGHAAAASELREVMDQSKVPGYLESTKEAYEAKNISRTGILLSLLHKNFMRFLRSPSFYVFLVLMPVVQLGAFYGGIGTEPVNINIAVVNHELPVTDLTKCDVISGCEFQHLSCRYLKFVNDDFNKVSYNDLAVVDRDFQNGRLQVLLQFHSNFSRAMETRLLNGIRTDAASVDQSMISVTIENSFFGKKKSIEFYVRLAFDAFFADLMQDCKQSHKTNFIPMRKHVPILHYASYSAFMAPGAVLIALTYMINTLSSNVISIDKLEGTWSRNQVVGIKILDILVSHVVTLFTVMLFQAALCLGLYYFVIGLENNGSFTLTVFLFITVGLCGISFGMLVSSLGTSPMNIALMLTGMLLFDLQCAGALWPVQGAPLMFQKVIKYVPLVSNIEALRNIVLKGFGLGHHIIYEAFIYSYVFVFTSLTTAYLFVRYRSY